MFGRRGVNSDCGQRVDDDRDACLESLQTLVAWAQGLIAIRSSDLPGATRQRLVKAGFLHKVMRGWYIPASPDEVPDDSTPWYTSFWTFIARYLDIRFRNRRGL